MNLLFPEDSPLTLLKIIFFFLLAFESVLDNNWTIPYVYFGNIFQLLPIEMDFIDGLPFQNQPLSLVTISHGLLDAFTYCELNFY